MFAALIFLIPTANVYGKEIIETGISINNGENDAVVTENILNTSSSYLGFQGYNDVSVTDWFYHSVVLVTDRLIMNGSYGYFYPNNRLTRAEAVTILGRVYGDNVIFDDVVNFLDVPSNHWAHKYISWAQRNGIVNGVTTTTFEPNSFVTRQDFAVMMVRYLQSVEKLSIPVNYSLVTYTDDSQISSYARNAVYSLQQAGVFARERENSQIYFRPQSYILRSETAKTVINSETLLYSVSKSVSSEQYCTIGKFSPSLILGKMYTGTTNKYRITGNWLVLYSTACFTKAPLSITDKYEVSLFVVDPFELRRSDSDTIIDRPATAIPSYLGDTSLWLHNAKSANNTYRCYYNGEASWKMVHVARLFAYETGKCLIGSAVTINTDLLN